MWAVAMPPREEGGKNKLACSTSPANGEGMKSKFGARSKTQVNRKSLVDFGTAFHHLSTRWLESEQLKVFDFAHPANAVDGFQHLGINAKSITGCCHQPFARCLRIQKSHLGKKLRT